MIGFVPVNIAAFVLSYSSWRTFREHRSRAGAWFSVLAMGINALALTLNLILLAAK